jgi:hypothetical protein
MVTSVKVRDGDFDHVKMLHHKGHGLGTIDIDVAGQVTHAKHGVDSGHLGGQVREFVEHTTVEAISSYIKVEGQVKRLVGFGDSGVDEGHQKIVIEGRVHTNVLTGSKVLMVGVVIDRGSDI